MLWSYEVNERKKKELVPVIKNEDGTFTDTDLGTPEGLSLFFKSVFVTEALGFWQMKSTTHKHMDEDIDFTEKERLEEIQALDTTISAGVENISPRTLKKLGQEKHHDHKSLINAGSQQHFPAFG